MDEKERSEFLKKFYFEVQAEIEALIPADQLKNIMIRRARELRTMGEGQYFCVQTVDSICYCVICHLKGKIFNELETTDLDSIDNEEIKRMERLDLSWMR